MEKGKAVTFEHLVFSRSSNRILKGISLHLDAGLVHGIIGPSGSGKTTLLQMINGLQKPDQGKIFIGTEQLRYDPHYLSRQRKEIGYAIQEYGVFPHLTAWKNVRLPGVLQGWKKAQLDSRAEELLSMVHLTSEKWKRYPHELSGGEKQRIGLCRALFLDPPVLLLDEAFGALDPVTRVSLQEELLAIQARFPRTIVLVTHDIEEALKLSDNLILIKDGEIIQSGHPEDVLKNPVNEFVAGYTARPNSGDEGS